jgi:hypothetical protein
MVPTAGSVIEAMSGLPAPPMVPYVSLTLRAGAPLNAGQLCAVVRPRSS